MFDLKKLAPIETKWHQIEASYRIAPYSAPLNRTEERQKVLDAYQTGEGGYNPQFIYKPLPSFPVAEIRSFMATLNPDDNPIEQLYEVHARNSLLEIESIETRSPALITSYTSLANGLPDRTLLAAAEAILAMPTTEVVADEEAMMPAEEAAARMQVVLDQSAIQGWKAKVFEPMSSQMAVNRLDREVKLRKGLYFSELDLQRLIVHEIGVHVLRYENGKDQPIQFFRSGFPRYIATEEGLAVYSEERAGTLQQATMRKYAGRVIAANLALSQPFSEVFHRLVADLDFDTAFEIATRAKRGFADTSQSGAHVKDIAYLQGYLAVKAHLDEHPDDYSVLFMGKFGLQNLPLVRALLDAGILKEPTLLPDDL